MRIVCPSCEAAYDVPAAVIDAGRRLRCARCGADFTPEGAPPPAPLAALPEPSLPAEPQPVAPAPPEAEIHAAAPLVARVPARSRPWGVALAWMLSFVLLGAMGWAAVTWRGQVMRAWPPSERAYALLGLQR